MYLLWTSHTLRQHQDHDADYGEKQADAQEQRANIDPHRTKGAENRARAKQ
jgi:hypothetical protein